VLEGGVDSDEPRKHRILAVGPERWAGRASGGTPSLFYARARDNRGEDPGPTEARPARGVWGVWRVILPAFFRVAGRP
jgi:hypothetical protein